jgi:hypothetical protein
LWQIVSANYNIHACFSLASRPLLIPVQTRKRLAISNLVLKVES